MFPFAFLSSLFWDPEVKNSEETEETMRVGGVLETGQTLEPELIIKRKASLKRLQIRELLDQAEPEAEKTAVAMTGN